MSSRESQAARLWRRHDEAVEQRACRLTGAVSYSDLVGNKVVRRRFFLISSIGIAACKELVQSHPLYTEEAVIRRCIMEYSRIDAILRGGPISVPPASRELAAGKLYVIDRLGNHRRLTGICSNPAMDELRGEERDTTTTFPVKDPLNSGLRHIAQEAAIKSGAARLAGESGEAANAIQVHMTARCEAALLKGLDETAFDTEDTPYDQADRFAAWSLQALYALRTIQQAGGELVVAGRDHIAELLPEPLI